MEKREAIIRAAMEEFAVYGYAGASTNRIVKAAGIGKGMLFYYFGSKRELYTDLIAYTLEFVRGRFGELERSEGPNDIIETFKRATKVKMEAMLVNPPLFDMITRIYYHPEDLAVSDEVRRKYEETMAWRDGIMRQIFARPDLSRLRKDIPPDRLVKYINWSIDGYAQSIIQNREIQDSAKLSDLDLTPFWAEFDKYVEDLKTLFYL